MWNLVYGNFEHLLSIPFSLVIGGVLITYYLKYRIKALFYWGIAWFFSAFENIFEILGIGDAVILGYTAFAMLIYYGMVTYITKHDLQENIPPIYVPLALIAFPVYTISLRVLGIPVDWHFVEMITIGLAGFYVMGSGVIFIDLKNNLGKNALFLGLSLIAYGLFYMVMRPIALIAEPINNMIEILEVTAPVLSAYFMLKLAISREFLFFKGKVRVKVQLKPGTRFVSSEEYNEIKEELKDFPVLAFVRNLNVPEAWRKYFITNTQGKDTISPTNLPYMLELANKYLREGREKGIRGVVVIDCLEYLVVYNNFETIVRFLSTLRDFALINDGVVVIALDEKSWKKKEMAILKRILG
ncbi:hypothetical protein PAP_02445 [Palaeococcus pacificus DY20341]|uniref:DUF835 domain-containing protein n=1 Tax=Palaeococcus pacificus DY20341 TaxID=1343739 RepID=A0A075LRG4_9EURY|nr:DUF835 domain-containing protein [Palaeococcus pacificus]AIF68919.1 hypothetical protein PAP_02445 [Palaeococcus pacificus DY20341]